MSFENDETCNTLKGEDRSVSGYEFLKGHERQGFEISECVEQDNDTILSQRVLESEVAKFFKVPVSSTRPLIGKAGEVLTHLKANLLDIEVALPENGVRSSKASIDKRFAWRAFVKGASTIYEMVQAMIVLEDMINLNYLDLSWRQSSSFSAAAKISTLAALSLPIYSFDAAINYDEISCTLKPTELGSGSDKEKRQQKLGSTGQPQETEHKNEGTI